MNGGSILPVALGDEIAHFLAVVLRLLKTVKKQMQSLYFAKIRGRIVGRKLVCRQAKG